MRFGFLGPGSMARAIAAGLLRADVCGATDIAFAARGGEKAALFSKTTGARRFDSAEELAAACETLLLCVKPVDALPLLEGLARALRGKPVISVVAGLRLAAMDAALGGGARLVRAMPNTPLAVGYGATALVKSDAASVADLENATRIFRAAGKVFPVAEEWMDAVTGLSGSGPAFVFLVMEALAAGGARAGLPADIAAELTLQTTLGAAMLARETGVAPAELREQVTSPAGTTLAGLRVLGENGAREALEQAVAAAAARSAELGAK